LSRYTREREIIRARRLRLDTTAVETDIHHPTDSSLLGDGVRVPTRTTKRIAQIAGRAGKLFNTLGLSQRSADDAVQKTTTNWSGESIQVDDGDGGGPTMVYPPRRRNELQTGRQTVPAR